MKLRKLVLCAALVAAACNGQLSIGPNPGSAGSGGGDGAIGGRDGAAGGRNSGTAGSGTAGLEGVAGKDGPGAGGAIGTGGSGVAGSEHCLGCAGLVDTGGWGPLGVAGGSSSGLGALGLPCIPGGLVTEADGTPAKAQIKTLPHCAEGLACDANNTCVPIPDCPQDGDLCAIRHAALGAGGAGGGFSSVPGWGGETSHYGGSSSSYGGDGSAHYGATDPSGVTAMTASESQVFWVEYGTRDALGNYQHDGALLAYAPDNGTTSTVASGLEGPIGVEITTSHAYIYVDGARPPGTTAHPQLLRVPLTGGTVELLQEGMIPAGFAAANGRAFWNTESLRPNPKIYSLTSEPNAVPTEFLHVGSYRLASDGTDLYYSENNGGLMRTPISSAVPVALNLSAWNFVLRDDSIYALESVSSVGLMLSSAPKSGGELVRVRALGAGYPNNLRRAGARYFFDATAPAQQGNGWPCCERQLTSASFVGNDAPIRLLHRLGRPSSADQLWAATANALYWSEGRAVYKQPIPTP